MVKWYHEVDRKWFFEDATFLATMIYIGRKLTTFVNSSKKNS